MRRINRNPDTGTRKKSAVAYQPGFLPRQMTEYFPHPRRSRLLAALPRLELLRLAPELDPVELHWGRALYESGTAMSSVYFPTTALVSMVYEFEDGSLDQRLCRWLLLSLDRMEGNDVGMTQELIANMLGVRREGVTAAVQQLQRLGLIHCTRGHIAVLDRRGLEQRACECYAVVRKEYERLLPHCAEPKERGGAMAPRRTAQPSPAGVFASERTAVAQPATVFEGQFD